MTLCRRWAASGEQEQQEGLTLAHTSSGDDGEGEGKREHSNIEDKEGELSNTNKPAVRVEKNH
jgi:hypothetical protein